MADSAIRGLPAWSNGVVMGERAARVGEPAGIGSRVRAWLGVLTSVFVRPAGVGEFFGDGAPSLGGPRRTGRSWVRRDRGVAGAAILGVHGLLLAAVVGMRNARWSPPCRS